MNRSMSRLIPALLLLLVLALPRFALAEPVFIPRLGLNFPSFSGRAEFGGFESRTGYQVGCDFRLGSPALFLQPGAYFKIYKATVTWAEGPSYPGGSSDNTFRTWQFPALVGTTLVEGQSLDLVLCGGMVLDLISSTGGGQALDEDDLANGTWAARFGLNLEGSRFSLAVSYDVGLSRFLKKFHDSDLKVSSFDVGLGVTF